MLSFRGDVLDAGLWGNLIDQITNLVSFLK